MAWPYFVGTRGRNAPALLWESGKLVPGFPKKDLFPITSLETFRE